MKVIYFGTPSFAAEVLTFLLENGIDVVAVVSKPDKPKGRSGTPLPTPVKLAALGAVHQLPVYQPEFVSSPDFSDILKAYEADFFVVVAYGEILKQHLLDMPKKACINLHGSLLPKYRGAAPIQRAIMEGESESGVTIMHMVKKMDAGDMIKKVIVPIDPVMTFGELQQKLCEVGKIALLDVIHHFDAYDKERQLQNVDEVTFAPKIELEDCEIDWNHSAQHIHNLVRGANPYPGAWASVLVKGHPKKMKIIRTQINPSFQGIPGIILNLEQTKGNLLVACGDFSLELIEVQLEGKKAMSSEELTRGIPRSQLSFS